MRRRLLIGFILLGLAFSLQESGAYCVKSLDSPFPVISGTRISTESLQGESDFYATLSEPLQFGNATLPEGTQFIGYTSDTAPKNKSRSFEHVDIWIEKVLFLNGEHYTIYPNEQLKPHLRLKRRSSSHQNLVNAGDRVLLQFNPATMKGIFRMAKENESPTEAEILKEE